MNVVNSQKFVLGIFYFKSGHSINLYVEQFKNPRIQCNTYEKPQTT